MVMLFSWVSPVLAAPQVTKDQFYARSTLKGKELKYYDAVYAAFPSRKSVDYKKYGLSYDRAIHICYYMYYDEPKTLGGHFSKQKTKAYNEKMSSKAKEILKLVDGKMSDYEKARAIYCYLGEHVAYDWDVAKKPNDPKKLSEQELQSHSAYGALINERAICDGISGALQYLLYRAGIPCYSVNGKLRDGSGSGHTWSMIRVDGGWYYADLTQDLENVRSGAAKYFLLDDTAIGKDHVFDKSLNPILPVCGSDKYMEKAAPEAAVAEAAVADTAAAALQEESSVPWDWIMIGGIICLVTVIVVIIVVSVSAKRKKRMDSQ